MHTITTYNTVTDPFPVVSLVNFNGEARMSTRGGGKSHPDSNTVIYNYYTELLTDLFY